MRVAHIIMSLGYGGIETMLVNIANEQVKQGVEVAIIIVNDNVAQELKDRISPSVIVFQLHRIIGSKSLAFTRKLNQALEEFRPDVIHQHYGVFYNYLNSKWRNNISCSVCCTLHDMPRGSLGVSWRWGRLFQNLVLHKGGNVMNLNRVKKVFAISNSVAEALKKDFQVDSTVVCNGIHTERFAQRPSILPGGVFQIVQVSRLDHIKKGQDLLIEAIKKLSDKGVNVHATFIGEGGSRAILEEMVVNLRLHNKISFLGTKSQEYLTQHLRDYDLFVQPSRFEGFGLTVAEAMAANVPVLVSEGQGPAEVTVNETYGWVFESGNSDKLADKIDYLINDYDRCLQKVDKARKHVVEKYDVSVTASNYLKAYHEMIND